MTAQQSRVKQALGRSRGGLTTKIHAIGDGRGRSLATRLTGGQAADTKELVALLDAVGVPRPDRVGRHRKRLDHLLADKAYGSRANRRALRARGIPHSIPERDDVKNSRVRKGSRGGRPPKFDAARYRNRNQIERGFGRRKQYRAVATRYDKLASRYQATVTIASIMDWLRATPDRRRHDPSDAL